MRCALLPFLALLSSGSAQTTTENAATPVPINFAPFTDFLIQVQPFEEMLDRALAAYNGGESTAFWADAAETATPPATAKTFRDVYEGYYKVEFGKVLSKMLIPPETQPDRERGVLVYQARFEKRSRVRISANFRRESGDLKIVQVRFEKM